MTIATQLATVLVLPATVTLMVTATLYYQEETRTMKRKESTRMKPQTECQEHLLQEQQQQVLVAAALAAGAVVMLEEVMLRIRLLPAPPLEVVLVIVSQELVPNELVDLPIMMTTSPSSSS
jgi:hypothetical protein